MRFRSEQHLRRPGEIRGVREQGQRIDCRPFTLWWHRRDVGLPLAVTVRPVVPVKTARVCVIASTAAIGNAVHRNRAKRRLREAFRVQQAAAPADCDFLLIARRAVAEVPMADLQRAFVEACQRIPAPGRGR